MGTSRILICEKTNLLGFYLANGWKWRDNLGDWEGIYSHSTVGSNKESWWQNQNSVKSNPIQIDRLLVLKDDRKQPYENYHNFAFLSFYHSFLISKDIQIFFVRIDD